MFYFRQKNCYKYLSTVSLPTSYTVDVKTSYNRYTYSWTFQDLYFFFSWQTANLKKNHRCEETQKEDYKRKEVKNEK